MPEMTAIQVGIIALTAFVAAVAGWMIRSNRSAKEKTVVHAGWQEQIEAQRIEHRRLVDQNKGLMEQVSQFTASSKDATNRSRELSTALKEALERRDELQRELKAVNIRLQTVVTEREQLEIDMRSMSSNRDSVNAALAKKDDKIFKLSRELESWHQRLPPLIERFRERNSDVDQLKQDLAAAREQISSLESVLGSDQTRVESVDSQSLSDNLDASNDTLSREAHINDAPVDRLRDDLKVIKGIGPAIEKTLNELGIFHLNQIAEMSEYDIDRVASRLKGFRSRIYREDWIGQARELRDQMASDYS
ncbi:MAG: hypothetical protein OER97_00290 [Gammaproteobacteria bacterium]|nr:hypothetical protein [Gammaproteobacteria bacterium]